MHYMVTINHLQCTNNESLDVWYTLIVTDTNLESESSSPEEISNVCNQMIHASGCTARSTCRCLGRTRTLLRCLLHQQYIVYTLGWNLLTNSQCHSSIQGKNTCRLPNFNAIQHRLLALHHSKLLDLMLLAQSSDIVHPMQRMS